MPAREVLQNALEELHAASACLGAAKRTNYRTEDGRRAVRSARRRLEQAVDGYYTILMSIRG